MDQRGYEILAGYNRSQKELLELKTYILGLLSTNEHRIEVLERDYQNEDTQILKIKCINVGYRTIADEISVRVDELARKAFALTRDG